MGKYKADLSNSVGATEWGSKGSQYSAILSNATHPRSSATLRVFAFEIRLIVGPFSEGVSIASLETNKNGVLACNVVYISSWTYESPAVILSCIVQNSSLSDLMNICVCMGICSKSNVVQNLLVNFVQLGRHQKHIWAERESEDVITFASIDRTYQSVLSFIEFDIQQRCWRCHPPFTEGSEGCYGCKMSWRIFTVSTASHKDVR